jgi:geranylgeranyl diphosphate synthase type II
MYTSDEILNKVNEYIEHLPYDRKPESLYAPIKYVLSLGGKRIRPTLMMLSYNLYKDDVENILPAACAIETYHNYTLLHDDLMDNALLRRGHQTVHAKWDANTAILSGDSMLVTAYQQMLTPYQEIGNNQKAIIPVIQLFTETALEIGEGQQYDMDFENRMDVTEEEYIEMIRLKTSVLLACAMKIGGILADAPEEDINNLYKFGEQMGLAFQLQDDFLDVYGDTKIFGKAIGGDITSNKKTYMLINACNLANEEQRKELSHWLSLKEFDAQEKIKAVTRLYNEIGIDQLAQRKMEYYYEQSRKYLNAVNVSEERKTELRDYAAQMMKRKY